MAVTFRSLIKSGVDLAPLGLYPAQPFSPYFCTPKGANVLYRTGVDGIHYCTVPGFGSMVFAVNPENDFGRMVQPAAADFEEFLRLLMACGNEAALEQAHIMTKAEFEQYLAQNPPQQDALDTVKALENTLGLVPETAPYDCLMALQKQFDESRIPFTREYRELRQEQMEILGLAELKPDPPKPWKLYFAGGSRRSGREHAGQEIRCNVALPMPGWSIPAVYLCSKGLSVLLAKCIEPEQLQAWRERRRQLEKKEEWQSSLLLQEENPFRMEVAESRVRIKGKTLDYTSGWGCCWEPQAMGAQPEDIWQDPEGLSAVEHFGLDRQCGWSFWVMNFPWATQRRPAWTGCTLTLREQPALVPGPLFHTEKPGDSVEFVHPADGQLHRLTVLEQEEQTLDEKIFADSTMEYPTHMTVVAYTEEPPLPEESIRLYDCDMGDRPRPKQRADSEQTAELARRYGFLPQAEQAAAVIIGGVDGPSAVLVQGMHSDRRQTGNSSLHFEPVKSVTWKVILEQPGPQPVQVQIPAE